MKFLLPTKVPQYDFQFQLLASQDYWTNFKDNPMTIEYVEDHANFEHEYTNGKWNDYCPVGSIEFCNKYGITTLPRNIPPQLKNFAVGDVATCRDKMKEKICYWHVKSSKQIKHLKNGMYTNIDEIPFEDNEFQAVEWMDEGFISEWRVFVLEGSIIDMQNYSGDIWTLPNKLVIYDMIDMFERVHGANPPPAYTLDVGVIWKNGNHVDHYDTCVIEVHDFYACGTYNLNDHYHYPIMLWEWWNWHRKNCHA